MGVIHVEVIDVRNIATELDILDSYDNKQIFDISMARLKCITQMSEDWVLDLNNKPKLRTYKLFLRTNYLQNPMSNIMSPNVKDQFLHSYD